jgi:hypothetical protein
MTGHQTLAKHQWRCALHAVSVVGFNDLHRTHASQGKIEASDTNYVLLCLIRSLSIGADLATVDDVAGDVVQRGAVSVKSDRPHTPQAHEASAAVKVRGRELRVLRCRSQPCSPV